MKTPKGLTPAERAEWHRICGELRDAGRLFTVDCKLIELTARTWARIQDLQRKLPDESPTLVTPNGCLQINPVFKLHNDTVQQWRGLLRDLRLTPAARQRGGDIMTPAEDPDDALAAFTEDGERMRRPGCRAPTLAEFDASYPANAIESDDLKRPGLAPGIAPRPPDNLRFG